MGSGFRVQAVRIQGVVDFGNVETEFSWLMAAEAAPDLQEPPIGLPG